MEWHKNAACRGMKPDTFFPIGEDDAVAAKAVCRTCSVRAACLDYALRTRQRYGVWGGWSEEERY